MEKIHWKKVFNSDYLGACDLEPGQDLVTVIKNVTIRKVKNSDGKEHERNVAIFTDENLKPMILNATNCRIMKKFTGSPYITDWNNVKVIIYIKDDIKAFGDVTEGLRLRDKQPVAKPKLTPDTEPWIKAVAFLKGSGTMDQIKKKYDLTPEDEETLKNDVL